MQKSVCIYFNDIGFSGLDFSELDKGNPGVGGTHYEFALLIYYLSFKMKVTVVHHNGNKMPNSCNEVMVSNFEEALSQIPDNNVLICQANIPSLSNLIERYKVETIVWSHNFLEWSTLTSIAKSKYIKKLVCVGDTLFFIARLRTKKACMIYNMISPVSFTPRCDRGNVVTYIGSIVPAKGFHVLAEVWPDILKEVPDAELFVIGSGKLYNRNFILGKYGIAQEDYENKIMAALRIENGHIPSNIHFMGNMGIEKKEIIEKTLVGVCNPTGKTETFGISALDFNCGGVLAVGNMPTIKTGRNGYRTYTKAQFRKTIINCLKNRQRTIEQGLVSQKWVCERYFPYKIIKQWEAIINE